MEPEDNKTGPFQETLFPDVDNADKVEPEVDETADRIAALEAEIKESKEREARNQEIIANMSKQPPAQQQVQQQEFVEEAPDPITDPEGYKAHLKAEIKGEVDQEIGAMRSENNKKETYNQIWGEFAKNHGDLAENHIDLVKFQATEVLKEVHASGLDPQQYLITNKSVFLNDVASRTQAMISKIKGDSLDTGRTDGVLSNSPRVVTPKKEGSGGQPSGFVKQLQDAQLATGFF